MTALERIQLRYDTIVQAMAVAGGDESSAALDGIRLGLEMAMDELGLATLFEVEEPTTTTTTQNGASADAEAPAASPAAAPEAPVPSSESIKTPERSELLRQLWPNPTLSVGQILLRLNALPGKPIQTPPTLYGWAKSLGLPSTRTSQPGFDTEAPPPAASKPAPSPAKPPPAAAAPPPARSREEQVAEARRLRKEGHTPEAIARRAGLQMDDVRALQAAAEQTARELIDLGTDTDQVVIEAGLPPARVRALRDEMRAAKRATTAA